LRFQAQRTIEIFARFTNIYASSRLAQKKKGKKKKKKEKKEKEKEKGKSASDLRLATRCKSSSRLSPPPSRLKSCRSQLPYYLTDSSTSRNERFQAIVGTVVRIIRFEQSVRGGNDDESLDLH